MNFSLQTPVTANLEVFHLLGDLESLQACAEENPPTLLNRRPQEWLPVSRVLLLFGNTERCQRLQKCFKVTGRFSLSEANSSKVSLFGEREKKHPIGVGVESQKLLQGRR